jgi:hypothetical protein
VECGAQIAVERSHLSSLNRPGHACLCRSLRRQVSGQRTLCREQLRANSPHFLDERDPATPLN